MVPLNAPELKRIAESLREYNLKSTVTKLGGLLTAPTLQANTIRIETLVLLSVAHCHGYRNPSLTEIDQWLNRQLGNTLIASLEDPVEDVFVTNVETPEGNRRVFEGIWEANDYYAQVVLDTLNSRGAPKECRDLLPHMFALLKLSDCVAERVGLRRWNIEPSIPNTTTPVMVDHFGYFSRHFFVWDFWDFSLFCLCFMNQAITFWGFQVILGRTTSRSRRISGTVANTFFFFPLPLHSFQKGKGKH